MFSIPFILYIHEFHWFILSLIKRKQAFARLLSILKDGGKEEKNTMKEVELNCLSSAAEGWSPAITHSISLQQRKSFH